MRIRSPGGHNYRTGIVPGARAGGQLVHADFMAMKVLAVLAATHMLVHPSDLSRRTPRARARKNAHASANSSAVLPFLR